MCPDLTIPASDGQAEPAVLYDARGPIAWITLNRPRALNAINGQVHQGLLSALARANADGGIRVVILRGNGRAFSAGGDLKAVAAGEDMGHPSALGAAIWDLAKPVVAAVHGYCLGQACELAAVADLTLAAEGTQFGEVEINHGWGPPLVITPYVLTLKRAKEILLLGETFGAQLAMEIGLVNRVVPDDALTAEADRVASRLAGLDPSAVAGNKRLVNQIYEQAGFLRDVPGPAGPRSPAPFRGSR
jgi:enoyl-CoA hydratase/carnithine racemase